MSTALKKVYSEGQLDLVSSIHALEESMLDMPDELHIKEEEYTNHYFAPGVYARELLIPQGATLTGKIHKTKHLNIVSKGKIMVASLDGQKIIEAPYVFVSEPGTKRAGYALEDTVWVTIHVTEETDVENIEEEVIALDYKDPILLEYFASKLIEHKE